MAEKEVRLILSEREITAINETVDELLTALSTRRVIKGGVDMNFLNVLTNLKQSYFNGFIKIS